MKLRYNFRDHLKGIGPLVEKGVVTFGGKFPRGYSTHGFSLVSPCISHA